MKNSDSFACILLNFLVYLMFAGCEDKLEKPDRNTLLTSAVWGETDYQVSDPELYTCVFEPSGNYYTTYKGFETFTGTWSLVNENTLKINGWNLEISRLTSDVLEYVGEDTFLGLFTYKRTYHLQALRNPQAATIGFSDIKKTSVKLHGIVRSCLQSQISFDLGTTQSYGGSVSVAGFNGPVNRPVSVELSGLAPETIYHFRTKIETEKGTVYGNDVIFKTLNNQTVTDIDNNIYNTVTIGNQTWMAEDLRTTKYIDGTKIPQVTDNQEWGSLSSPAFCWYQNDSLSNTGIVALYNWYAGNTGKLCPTGWHVPSITDWSVLMSCLGGMQIKLIKPDFSYYNPMQSVETNQTGFSASEAKMRDGAGYYYNLYRQFWSTDEFSTDEGRYIMFYFEYSGYPHESKKFGKQVRCLKD